MRQRLIQAAAVGFLFSLAGPVFSQMEIREGKQHVDGGGINSSTSKFAVGLTRDGGATFVSSAVLGEVVEIRGEIQPEPGDVDKPASIFVVDRLLDSEGRHLRFEMQDQDGEWHEWKGEVSLLVPFQEGVNLRANHEITLFTGPLSIAGAHRIFLGYKAGDRILRYHTNGLPVTITEAPTQTPREQAKALFESTIHSNIVQANCGDTCHRPGYPLTAGLHQFIPGSGQTQIDANFEIFVAMVTNRGKDFILAKVRNENAHLGGSVLVPGAPGYADFETFLTLLEQR